MNRLNDYSLNDFKNDSCSKTNKQKDSTELKNIYLYAIEQMISTKKD